VLDGAQNTASARALVNAVKSCFVYKRLILVLGISADKDIEGICRVLGPLADEVVVTASDNPRAAKPKDLALSLAPFTRGKAVHLTKDTHAAEDLACRLAGRKDLILVTGSLFLVGDFLGEKSSTF
jgi:dihydrofolate synthase/folylpolyglutamate synthase